VAGVYYAKVVKAVVLKALRSKLRLSRPKPRQVPPGSYLLHGAVVLHASGTMPA